MLNPFTTVSGLKKLHDLLNSKAEFSFNELNKIVSKLQFKKIKKGEVLIAAGETENYISFVLSGTMRTFFFKDEKEVCLEFFFEGDLTGSLASFLTRKPSTLSQEALSTVSLAQLSYNDLQELYSDVPKLEKASRMLTEGLFMKSSDKVIELLSMSAIERYEKLIEQHPKYYQNIPLKYLASYLNVTPESLSRIRKNI